MAKNDPIAKTDRAFAAQLNTFKNAIGSYAALLGLSPAQVARQAADADYFTYALACQDAAQGSAQGWTGWKNLMRRGGATAAGAPQPVVLPAMPAVVPDAGIEARFRALMRLVKASPAYNASIGAGLGIEAVDHAAPDFVTLKPALKLSLGGNAVFIGWDWGGYSTFLDMIELQADRGDGAGFGLLVFDSTPGFTDPTPFPATPVKWKYRGIYRVGDGQVGQWSDAVAITVGA
ncbi:MAG: hypothetical protein ABIP85_18035 [Chthoniobacteraceae bacterium]